MTTQMASAPMMSRYLTEAEQAQLLRTLRESACASAPRDRAWIELMLATGCRVSEFASLTIGDLRAALATGWLFVPAARRKGKRLDLQVPLTKLSREAMLELLDIAGPQALDAEPAVASRKGGRALSVRAFQQRLAYWSTRSGKTVSPHWLRHTRAMRVMRKSSAADPRGIVQALLGHSSIASTAIYTRPSREDVAAALIEVDGGTRLSKAAARAAHAARVGQLEQGAS